MARTQKELMELMSRIHKRYPSGGARYSTVIEDPYRSGYMPMHKPTKRDLQDVNKALKKRGLVAAH